LIGQAEAELSGIGIGSEPYDGKRKLKHHSRVYLAMIETTYRRVQKNKYFFPNIGLVICDEAHILVFNKVFSYFDKAKILGCTATPIVTKRETFYKCKYCRISYPVPTECCNETEADEWTRPYSLSKIYKNISVGPQPEGLIEFGSIVQEISFKRHYTDDSTLKTDSDGEFVAETVEREYGTTNAAFNVVLNYEELCLGKKTLIFNSSTKTNLVVYEKFIAAGYTNVRMFDSVNAEQSGNRAQLLEWFEETPDAILINAKIFTTGFNSRQVEAIIVNRPVGVLSLWLQICGRGCRSSLKIYKPNYILVDGGGNIDRFGEPSTSRDWYSIFHGKGA
jgi:superfamily II DNA or RNA helicase